MRGHSRQVVDQQNRSLEFPASDHLAGGKVLLENGLDDAVPDTFTWVRQLDAVPFQYALEHVQRHDTIEHRLRRHIHLRRKQAARAVGSTQRIGRLVDSAGSEFPVRVRFEKLSQLLLIQFIVTVDDEVRGGKMR